MRRFRLYVSGALLLIFAAGCGENKDDRSLAERSGEKLGRSAREFTVAVGKGVEDTRSKQIDIAPELKELGISFTVSKEINTISSGAPSLVLYMIAEKDFDGLILIKALNAKEQEIGRSRQTVSVKTEEAKYITFSFPREMDAASAESYRIQLGQEKMSSPAEK